MPMRGPTNWIAPTRPSSTSANTVGTKAAPVTTITWTNITEDTDFGTGGGTGGGTSAASIKDVASGTLTATATPAAGVLSQQLALASWSP